MRVPSVLAVAVAVVVSGCGPVPPEPVSYTNDLLPLFTNRCLSCHYKGSPTKLDLANPQDATEGLVNRETDWKGARHKVMVVPGKPEESWMMDKLTATDLDKDTEGNHMPFNVTKVTATELMNLRQWVTDGAKNDAFYTANVAPVFGNAANLGRQIGKCSYCHTAKSPYAPNVVDPFSSRGLVNVKSSFGGKRVLPGDPDNSVMIQKLTEPLAENIGMAMPPTYEDFSASEIELVRRWIAEGAKDN